MRKKMVAALISIFIAASLAACGGNSGTGSPTANTDQVQESEAATEQTEPADEQTSNQQDESQTATAADETGKLSLDTTIEETVLFEDDNTRIIAESLDFKYNSPYLHLKFENNGDKELSFVSGSIGYSGNSVNGYMVDGFYVNVDVEPGKTALEETYVNGDLLNILGIEKIKEIGIGFDIKDSDYNDYAQTGPLYIATSDADGADDGETYMKSIQNKKLKDITFDVDYDTLSINGAMTDFISYSKTLSPEVKSILNIEVSKYKLEDVKITSPEEISDIEFKLEIRDSDYNEIDNPTIQVTTK